MGIKVEFNENAVMSSIDCAVRKAQQALDTQVMADSNFFVPLKTSALQKSAEIHTRIGSGKVVWQTPYARRQYYGENFDHSKQHNPNATAKWFESAKARFLDKWVNLVNSIVRKGG